MVRWKADLGGRQGAALVICGVRILQAEAKAKVRP